MDGESSPMLEGVVAGEVEASASISSSEGGSGDWFGDGTGGQDEESGAVKAHESKRSYDFEPSTVTISRIRQLEALGYFAECSARESSEEVIPELANDEAVLFKEFFAAGLRMSPQPVLTDILLKFQVQVHQLIPNGFAQFSKYFLGCA
jgi:hypothetical protein